MYDIHKELNKFENRVEKYESVPVKEGLIMFYGDSGFTRWCHEYDNNNLEDDIRGKNGEIAVVNHGLGGSNTDQLLYWYPRMVRPWKPKVLVFKAYVNDRAQGYTANEIMFLQSRLFEYARTDMEGIKIIVSDAQPYTKNRGVGYIAKHQAEYHELLMNYCAKHDDVTIAWTSRIPELYNDPADIGNYDLIRDDLYIEDKVHFNKEGYRIYADFWREQLKDYL